MKTILRLALPPLERLAQDAVAAYALRTRQGQLLRSGQLPLNQLAQTVAPVSVQAVLHPNDAIVATIPLPPLPVRRIDAAVQACVEPMALSDISELCIAHGPRAADGSVCVAWTDRKALLQAWACLEQLGFKVDAFVPLALALPGNDPQPSLPLSLPVDERWSAPLPAWSLARPEWRPVSQGTRWRRPLLWLGAAALLWLGGLQLYAAQLRNEADRLQASIEASVRSAFPSIPVILDPVKQARSQRDMLRLEQGTVADDGFIALAMGAAQVLGFAQGHVASLQYRQGDLTLVLSEGYAPPSNETSLHQLADALSLTIEKDQKSAHTWHIRQADTPATAKAQP